MKTKPINTPEHWEELSPHPLSQLIEFGKGISIEAMADHMREHGFDEDEAIVLFEGMILDGRHRHAACKVVGNSPPFREFVGKSAAAYVSKKLFRQYPTVAERARMAAHYANLPNGQRPTAPPSNEGGATGDLPVAGMTTSEAAKTFGVSESSVERAKADAKKVYCAHCQTLQRKGQPPKQNCPMCKELRPSAPKKKKEPMAPTEKVDAFGTIVPKRCLDAYCDPWIQEAIDFIGVTVAEFWKKRLADGLNKRKKYYPWYVVKDFVDGCGMIGNTMEQVLEHLKTFRPAGVCPSCEGKGCPDCKMAGLVPRDEYKKLKKAKK